MAVRRFPSFANLAKKAKALQQTSSRDDTSPKHALEKEQLADQFESHDMPDRVSVDVGRPSSSTRSSGENKQQALHRKQDAKLSTPLVTPDHDSASSATCADPPNPPSNALPEQKREDAARSSRSHTILGPLKRKLRLLTAVPAMPSGNVQRVADKSVPARVADPPRESTPRPKAVPITLPNDVASRERREEALRARGLLPPRPARDLSAIEAEADRRIDALRSISTSFPGLEKPQSEANDIVKSWRLDNATRLSKDLPDLDVPADPMTQVISLVDISNNPKVPSEPPTAGADPASVPLPSSRSISKPPSLDSLRSPTQSASPVSSTESDEHQDYRPSRRGSLRSATREGLALPCPDLEDLPSEVPTEGISEDVNKHSAPLAPSLLVSSLATSALPESQIAEKQQPPTTPLQTQDSELPVPQLEGLPPLGSLSQLCSRPETALRLQSIPEGRPSEPTDFSSPAQPSISDNSPYALSKETTDSCLASPLTETFSSSMCYSSSESPDSPVTTENLHTPSSYFPPNKGAGGGVAPFLIKGDGNILYQSVIIKGRDSFPDDDEADAFPPPLITPLPKIALPDPSGYDPESGLSRPASHANLRKLKDQARDVEPSRSAPLSKSRSMVNLRAMTGSLFKRSQTRSKPSPLPPLPQTPRASPLTIKMHTDTSISMLTSKIDDDESRRLTELAFSM